MFVTLHKGYLDGKEIIKATSKLRVPLKHCKIAFSTLFGGENPPKTFGFCAQQPFE